MSYTSESQQMQALLNNAVSEASADHLMVGQALTPTQVANLTSNIVWYVTQITVTVHLFDYGAR